VLAVADASAYDLIYEPERVPRIQNVDILDVVESKPLVDDLGTYDEFDAFAVLVLLVVEHVEDDVYLFVFIGGGVFGEVVGAGQRDEKGGEKFCRWFGFLLFFPVLVSYFQSVVESFVVDHGFGEVFVVFQESVFQQNLREQIYARFDEVGIAECEALVVFQYI